ncbi:MAG: hypothetical protein ABR874_19150, partial [Candidatus Sulfotelmatobacter sp.]|jgi:hypothetical protein
MKTDLRIKPALRNITITLEEDLARWARIEAAREDTSVSQFLAELLRQRMREQDSYEQSMRRFLARKPFPKTDGKYPKREEIYNRARVR